MRQPALGAEASDVVDPLARGALDLGDDGAIEEVRLAEVPGAFGLDGHLVRARVVDPEVVELPRGAVAAEVGRIRIDLGRVQQTGELGAVLVAQLLLDAVGAEARDAPAHVQARLVDRVAERLPRIAADDERARSAP